jgi:hypothetical protein
MGAYRIPILLSALNVLLLVWLLATTSQAANGQNGVTSVSTLRANAIELVDDAGRVRAQLMMTEDGETLLRMRDARGDVRVKLGASIEGSGMVLANHDAQPGLHVLAKRGSTSLSLQDSSGQPRIFRATDP